LSRTPKGRFTQAYTETASNLIIGGRNTGAFVP
jgi:hypothetical protein